jgi:hypothetical protein
VVEISAMDEVPPAGDKDLVLSDLHDLVDVVLDLIRSFRVNFYETSFKDGFDDSVQ